MIDFYTKSGTLINWEEKGKKLRNSLRDIREALKEDPGCKTQSFFMVVSEPTLITVEDGTLTTEDVDLAYGKHLRWIQRLFFNVVDVNCWEVLVHASNEHLEELEDLLGFLEDACDQDKSNFAVVRDFSLIPSFMRIDQCLFDSHEEQRKLRVSLFPHLTKEESDAVIREILFLTETSLISSGKDYGGRVWIQCYLTKEEAQLIADRFYSIQSIYEPTRSSNSIDF